MLAHRRVVRFLRLVERQFCSVAGGLDGWQLCRSGPARQVGQLAASADLRAGGRRRGEPSALVHYKYLAALFGFLHAHDIADIAFANPVLPLGISFFTFTQIGYLLDCRNGLARDHSPLITRCSSRSFRI